MVTFILNNISINTALSPGLTLLDFIRYNQQLTGTKIGCREGDCGACTILVGETKNDALVYRSMTSCLMPLGNAQGKHIVTIEGINTKSLNVVQEAFAEEGATQCGFCTPGFIVSLAGFCINSKERGYQAAIDAVNGNICRCTGYKSIERAIAKIVSKLEHRNEQDAVGFAVENNIIPDYFLNIKDRLKALPSFSGGMVQNGVSHKFIAGGTDLYVQQHDTIVDEKLNFLSNKDGLKEITRIGNICEMGASVTATDILESEIFNKSFPHLDKFVRLVSSSQIRNMATVAGNFINASPIGDFTIFFLALDAKLLLREAEMSRILPLRELYKGYKLLNKTHTEVIEKIGFELPDDTVLFNFEKVSKRTHLDIASVNSAIMLKMNGNQVITAGLSAGGVGPVPAFLAKASMFLSGKGISAQLVHDLIEIVQGEIAPISDARGSEAYKRLLLSQLIKAHFIQLFPALPLLKLVHA